MKESKIFFIGHVSVLELLFVSLALQISFTFLSPSNKTTCGNLEQPVAICDKQYPFFRDSYRIRKQILFFINGMNFIEIFQKIKRFFSYACLCSFNLSKIWLIMSKYSWQRQGDDYNGDENMDIENWSYGNTLRWYGM